MPVNNQHSNTMTEAISTFSSIFAFGEITSTLLLNFRKTSVLPKPDLRRLENSLFLFEHIKTRMFPVDGKSFIAGPIMEVVRDRLMPDLARLVNMERIYAGAGQTKQANSGQPMNPNIIGKMNELLISDIQLIRDIYYGYTLRASSRLSRCKTVWLTHY